MKFYFSLIFSTVLIYGLNSYMIFKSLNRPFLDRYSIFAWITGIFPLWLILSKYSKNLVFDGILFDCVLLLTYTIITMRLTNYKFTINFFIGFIFIISGLFLIKRG